jgi:hypothetical protein
MRALTPARRLTLVLLLMLALTACGGDGVFQDTQTTDTYSSGTLDPSAPGVTGTVPIPGPADWLEWSPAEAPDAAAEAELVDALEELGLAMVIPTGPPPNGGPTSATFNSMSLGWGSGETFPGTTHVSLNLARAEPNFAIVSVPDETSCPAGSASLTVRGDEAACALEDGDYWEVSWREAGLPFRASFSAELTLEHALSWVETWRLLP